jgi:glutaredoxin
MGEGETIPELPADGAERRMLEAFDRLGVARLEHADLAAAARPANPEAVDNALAWLVATDCLREIAGRFERTALGRLEVAGPRNLTLLSRPGCHLCEEALHQLQQLSADEKAELAIVDVDTDRRLRELYSNDIPVLFLGNREIAQHRVNCDEVRRELAGTRL